MLDPFSSTMSSNSSILLFATEQFDIVHALPDHVTLLCQESDPSKDYVFYADHYEREFVNYPYLIETKFIDNAS